MDRKVYDQMAQHDTTHWWYRGRRAVLAAYLGRERRLPPDARLLEIGCGTGHNLGMLAAHGTVDAIEIDEAARTLAEERLGRPVSPSPLPELVGVERGAYDLVAVLDVIEHVPDDVAALRAMTECLAPGGSILITVPAHQWMWSSHDVVNHHFRRYNRRTLKRAIRDAGLVPRHVSYFNVLLFPLAVVSRLKGRLTGTDVSDDIQPPSPVNAALERILRAERHWIGRVPMPPGLSIVALAEPAR